jgi:hypothetical protein
MVYLQLFHGRKTPDEQMSGWGTEGPVLGPFPFVHSTYGSDIKVDSDAPIFRERYANRILSGAACGSTVVR